LTLAHELVVSICEEDEEVDDDLDGNEGSDLESNEALYNSWQFVLQKTRQ